MKLIYLKSKQKYNSFDISTSIEVRFFRVSITIEPGRLLPIVRYHELFDK